MSWKGCSRLNEVRQALEQGHWPVACSQDLHAHVAGCGRCRDEVLLTTQFQLARGIAVVHAPVASSNLIWWRGQLRQRDAVQQRAGRPLAAAQAFALVLGLVAIVGAIAAGWRRVEAAVPSLDTLRADWGVAPLVIGAGVLTMLFGVVVYLTAERQ
jgi:hypothetical protein